jgi:hypothetical protein
MMIDIILMRQARESASVAGAFLSTGCGVL